MPKNERYIDDKVKAYIDKLFTGVGESQQLFELKEELETNMKEKIADHKSSGMEDKQALKEAVISMGDLSELVDEMRSLGQNKAKQVVYSTTTARISIAGIITGVLLVCFGIFTGIMVYFMNLPAVEIIHTGIFIVAGVALITYSILTRETRKKYKMHKIRAAFYALSIGIILFGIYTAFITRFATGEIYKAIASLMAFFLPGIGMLLFLIFTGTDRRKNVKNQW